MRKQLLFGSLQLYMAEETSSLSFAICQRNNAYTKGKTPRIFLPWCFTVRAAYSVVIILPLILQTLGRAFCFTTDLTLRLFPSTSDIATPKSPLISTFTFSKNTKPRWLKQSITICFNQKGRLNLQKPHRPIYFLPFLWYNLTNR